jgi:glycosyltransferase involved in cell wall biosynthesis
MLKKISVIIPAYNESEYIVKAIKNFRRQNYENSEIIVIDNSTDGGKTKKLAEKYANKFLTFAGPIGVSNARNRGAEIADGEIFLFSDADSYLEDGSLEILVKEFGKNMNIIGSFIGKDEKKSIKSVVFFFFKNLIYRLRIHEGATAGTVFCSKEIFLKTGGFNKNKGVAEIQDFIIRAQEVGAKYRLITSHRAITSMRRYEKNGYLKTIWFWIAWKALNSFKINKNFGKNYHEKTKEI